MSRIEDALEKAAQLRNGLSVTAVKKTIPPSKSETESVQVPTEGGYASQGTLLVDISNPFLVTANDPGSPVAEEYRKLKSILAAFVKRDGFRNSLMVTSTLGGEGKSITALNLSITLAQEYDHTVLLIDADLRKPSLHRYFGLGTKPGIADCLLDGIDVGETLIRTGIGKLSFLPAGRSMANPAEMLSSKKMDALFAEMKNRYPDRYIIVDSPPVLPVAETRYLGSLVDGIIFVVKEGASSVDDIREASSAFDPGKILGIVYNDVTLIQGSGRYQYYNQGYGANFKNSELVSESSDQHPQALQQKHASRSLFSRFFRQT